MRALAAIGLSSRVWFQSELSALASRNVKDEQAQTIFRLSSLIKYHAMSNLEHK
jgi:hypothetical protein